MLTSTHRKLASNAWHRAALFDWTLRQESKELAASKGLAPELAPHFKCPETTLTAPL